MALNRALSLFAEVRIIENAKIQLLNLTKLIMRCQLLKLKKGHSTKSERKIAELLKKKHIPFKTKVLINKAEVDFLIGRVILEIDGKIHRYIDTKREKMLFDAGYVPIHISIKEIYENKAIEEKIINLIKSNKNL